jgi:hypothetical protein
MTSFTAGTRSLRIASLAIATILALGVGAAPAAELAFEQNLGQSDPRARFLARGRGYALFLTPSEAVLAFPHAGPPLRMRLRGAQDATVAGEGPLPGTSHYFVGSDPARFRKNVPSFERVRYASVYPGIDLVFYGHEGELEYDFVVAPGRDPRRVSMDLSGVNAMRVDGQGNLVLATGAGPVVWRKPVAYQVWDGERRPVESRYVVRGKRRVGFQVAAYDRTRPLVVDPTLAYSTYHGGSGADIGHAIGLDEAGNAYVTGETGSVDFPGTGGPVQGLVDAFVTKLDPSGTTRIYSVYLGGGGSDIGWGIAVDAGGSVYLTGETNSANFPTTAGAYQKVMKGTSDAFAVKLSAAGGLAYSTLLGGSFTDQGDRGNAVAVDSAGNMVVAGRTDSADFPVTPGALFTNFRGGEFDGFVAKLNPAATGSASLVYSTFLGGANNDAAFGVALDSAGNPYVVGGTASPDFPATADAYQGSNTGGGTDAFFAKLNANATGLLYSTFLGGSSSNERGNAVGVDAFGNAIITGQTTSGDFPTKNPIQPSGGGGYDAFVAKIDPTASGVASLVYSTYLGGSGDDTGRALAVDASGQVYVTGQTTSSLNFPLANAVQPTYGGGPSDAFVTKLSAAGTARLYSTYLGGSDTEGTAPNGKGGPGQGIAVSPCGDAWVTGGTLSTNFPTAGPVQAMPGGAGDAFVAKITDLDVQGVVPQWGPASGGSVVTIVGGCFRPGATATFGGSSASAVAVGSASAITATTPAHAVGPVDVVVTNPGLPPTTRTSAFTYGATGFFPLTPCRVVDTRNANGVLGGPALAANADRTFMVRNVCGIPATAGAISVNLTVVQPSAAGHLRVYAGGTPLPLVSSLNYSSGQTRANDANVSLGPGGTVAVRCVQASGSVHFLLDVTGYFE